MPSSSTAIVNASGGERPERSAHVGGRLHSIELYNFKVCPVKIRALLHTALGARAAIW